MPLYHLSTLPSYHHHPTTLSITLPPCHPGTLPPHSPTSLPTYHPATLAPSYHPTTLPPRKPKKRAPRRRPKRGPRVPTGGLEFRIINFTAFACNFWHQVGPKMASGRPREGPRGPQEEGPRGSQEGPKSSHMWVRIKDP